MRSGQALLATFLTSLAACGSGGQDLAPAVTVGPSSDILVPNNPATCADGYPIQINAGFPQPFDQQGHASCTVVTYSNVQPLTPGVVVSATLGVGQVTGPMRFVRLRILQELDLSPACCSAEEFGDVFTPQPGGLTSIPLGFAIEHGRDDATGIRFNDWIGLEVLDPTVPIPAVWTNNGGADVSLPTYMWLPALSARSPAPTPNLRSEGSFSGFVPTFNLQFAAAQ